MLNFKITWCSYEITVLYKTGCVCLYSCTRTTLLYFCQPHMRNSNISLVFVLFIIVDVFFFIFLYFVSFLCTLFLWEFKWFLLIFLYLVHIRPFLPLWKYLFCLHFKRTFTYSNLNLYVIVSISQFIISSHELYILQFFIQNLISTWIDFV